MSTIIRLIKLSKWLTQNGFAREAMQINKFAERVECYTDPETEEGFCWDTENEGWVSTGYAQGMPALVPEERYCVDWAQIAAEQGFSSVDEFVNNIYDKIWITADRLTTDELKSLGLIVPTADLDRFGAQKAQVLEVVPYIRQIPTEARLAQFLASVTRETGELLKGSLAVEYSEAMLDEACTTEDHIAFIFAHELAHGILQHVKSIAQSSIRARNKILENPVLIISPPGGEAYEINLQEAFGEVDMTLQKQEGELNSDTLGKYIATKAGYDPASGGQVVQRLRVDRNTGEEKDAISTPRGHAHQNAYQQEFGVDSTQTHPSYSARWQNLQRGQ